VAATEQRYQGEADFLALANDDPLDVRSYLLAGFMDRCH
jgi:hypothetical protein